MRVIQSLPERTATAAVYLFLGTLPIHKKQLSLLHGILSSDNKKIGEVLDRQISVNFDNKDSFFYRILKVLQLYVLPDTMTLKQHLPSKNEWKDLINSTVLTYWTETLLCEAQSKSIPGAGRYPLWKGTQRKIQCVTFTRPLSRQESYLGPTYLVL